MDKAKKNLIKYLASYTVAISRVEELRARRERLDNTLKSSYHGIVIDGMPKGHNVTDGMDKVAGTLDKISEITAELERQEAEAKDYVANIIQVLAILPEGSQGRRALELRFIDRQTTESIAQKLAIGVATYWRIYDATLEELLQNAEVRALVHEMEG